MSTGSMPALRRAKAPPALRALALMSLGMMFSGVPTALTERGTECLSNVLGGDVGDSHWVIICM